MSDPGVFRLSISWKLEDILADLGEFVIEHFFDLVFSGRVLDIFNEIVLGLEDWCIDLAVHFGPAVDFLLDLLFGGGLPGERPRQKIEEDED